VSDPKIDNVPEKLTAHAVRRLRPCGVCGGIGDRDMMIYGATHTSCYLKAYSFGDLLALPASERGKFRLKDLTMQQMKRLLE